MEKLTSIDAESKEFPGMPLWLRISEACPQVPDDDHWSYEHLRLLMDEVIPGKMSMKRLAEIMGGTMNAVCAMKNSILDEQGIPRLHQRPADPEIKAAVKRYVVKCGVSEAARLSGKKRASIRAAATRMGYTHKKIRGVKGGQWIAPKK